MKTEERARLDTLLNAIKRALNRHAPIDAREAGTIFSQLLIDVYVQAREKSTDEASVASEMRRMAARIVLLADTPLPNLRQVLDETSDERTH